MSASIEYLVTLKFEQCKSLTINRCRNGNGARRACIYVTKSKGQCLKSIGASEAISLS